MTINWAVEVGTLTLDLLLSSLSSAVSWSSNQKPTIWFFDKTMGADVMLIEEVQLQNLIEMYKSKMHCQVLLVVADKTVWEEHQFDALEPMCVIPPDTEPMHPEPQFEPTMQPEPMQLDPMQPEPMQPEPEQPSMPNIFDNEEEYVGVHDEHVYISIPPA